MEITKIHLTVKLVKSLKPGNPCRYCDTEVVGFQVWVGSRSIAFYLRKRNNGKEYAIKLGNWPDITLDEARKKALDILGSLCNYGMPDAPSGRVNPTVGEAIDYYMSNVQNENTARLRRCSFGYFASLRKRAIEDITAKELEDIYNGMKDRPAAATIAIQALLAAFRMLFRKLGKRYEAPVLNIKYYVGKPRTRYITREEMPRFFATLEKMSSTTKYGMMADMIYMLLYTGARKMNVCEMRLEEISQSMLWTIPAEKYKGGKREQYIQLGSVESAIVEKYRHGRTSGYVFPHERPIHQRLRYFFLMLCNEAGIDNLHIHDIRRTLGTWMLSSGTPIAIVSKKLGHTSIKITEQVYANAMPDVTQLATEHAIAEMHGQNGTSS